MLLASALFPGPLPAYVLPFVQGAAVAMAVARCHATASLVRAPSPASTDTMVLLLSALGSVGRAALLVCFQRCYFWATSRALAALNGGLLLARVVASLCLEPHSSTKLGPEASVLAAASLLVMALAFTLLFATLHLAAMRNEVLRRRVRTLQMMQASKQAA